MAMVGRLCLGGHCGHDSEGMIVRLWLGEHCGHGREALLGKPLCSWLRGRAELSLNSSNFLSIIQCWTN